MMRNENRSTGQINVSFSLPALETMVRMRSTVDGVRVLRVETWEPVRASHEHVTSKSCVKRHASHIRQCHLSNRTGPVHSSIHTVLRVLSIQYVVRIIPIIPSYDIWHMHTEIIVLCLYMNICFIWIHAMFENWSACRNCSRYSSTPSTVPIITRHSHSPYIVHQRRLSHKYAWRNPCCDDTPHAHLDSSTLMIVYKTSSPCMALSHSH